MRIALVGAGGQLAADLREKLAAHEVLPFLRSELDLCRPETIEASLGGAAVDLVINTAAYNLVDKAETEPLAALEVNAVGVANLAKFCGAHDLRLIHFSTDYVFGLDAMRDRQWDEEEAPGPVSVYGCSKLMGEYAVRTYAARHLVVRTCGLYGKTGSRGKGGNFVETMLRLADSGKPLRIVGDQWCTPSFTSDVAEATARVIETDAHGVLHLTNAGACTWFQFASAIFELAGKSVDCQQISSAEFGAAARRPPYSVLSLEKLSSLGISDMPDWRDAVGRYLKLRGAAVA